MGLKGLSYVRARGVKSELVFINKEQLELCHLQ